MNKFKTGLLFIAVFLFGAIAKAQTLDEGKKFMYYERYASAKSVFEKLVAANANNIDAVYWLGQAMILGDNNDVAGAKSLYQKTLMNNSNAALLLAGMGHVELLEGKQQDARNRFETAVSLTQGKNKDVLNAIGFANVQADKGDAEYAVQKLRQATEIKKMADPDVWANLGDAYKKLIQGGPAQTAYEAALALNPAYARAAYRIGKIYQTQGAIQKDIYMRYYDEAIAKDPAYAPVYENLYQYYYDIDVNKSAEYLEKFLATTDKDPRKDCYFRASMAYARGMFQEAVNTGMGCVSSGGADGPEPNVYAIIAYAYDKMNDSVSSKKYFETFFQKQKPDKIEGKTYITYAKVLLKFPDSTNATDSVAAIYIEKALALDSTDKGKTDLLKSAATQYEAKKKYCQAAKWYNRIVMLKKEPTKTDLYYSGYNYFRCGDYPAAINVFNIYSQKFPEDPFSYYMCGKSNWAIDSTLERGLANDCFQKAIEMAQKDSVKNKAQLIGSCKYFVVYSVFKKDKVAATSYIDRILALDPADAESLENKRILSGSPAAPAPKQTPAKPAAGTKSGGSKKK